MPLINREQILERGWSEETFESLTQNKGQIVKNGENFWHLNSIEKMERSEKFQVLNINPPITSNLENKPIIKSTLLRKEQILERGWSEDAIKEFISDSYSYIDKAQQKLWHRANIERIEKHVDFIFFNHREKFDSLTNIGKLLSESLNINFNKGNHLISKLDNYNQLKPIFHLVKEDFAPEENGSYTLFTDGSFKMVDKKAFASCGGWILDNKTNEVVIEFSKPLELDKNKKRSQPKFELLGIGEGVKLINQLGLKNVQIYTDSYDEARKLFLASFDYKDEHYLENADLYDPIFNVIKNSNSSISWIPREYNHHADELSEISLKTWEKQNEGDYKNKDYIAENGYKISREKTIYFHQNKAIVKEKAELTNQFTLIAVSRSIGKKEYVVSLMHDNINHRLSVIDAIPKDYSYINASLPDEIKLSKKAKPDSFLLAHLTNSLNSIEGYGDINICVTPLVLAVNDKVTPIPSDLQEEFFDFHKALHNYPGKITMTNRWPKLIEKINEYLQVVPDRIEKPLKPKM